ncbi:MAG: hypothetical protein E6Q98_19895 [Rhodospirillaceae bacterium]|nr:MAG: hypothetical protein E6Q98_19895 [Rhodospirillaceae bacterium]
MYEYDQWAHLRRPLPNWWLDGAQRDPNYPRSAGIVFNIRKNTGEVFRCCVPFAALCGLAGDTIPLARVDQLWDRYRDQLESAAKRKIRSGDVRGGQVAIELADLVLQNYEL